MKWYLLLGVLLGALWAALSVRASLGVVTRIDLVVVRAAARLRAHPLTTAFRALAAIASRWTVTTVAWATIAVLVVFRRFRHLATYVGVLLVVSLLDTTMASVIGRMRPAGVAVLGSWTGYAHPSLPIAGLALVLVGALYTLVPSGRWRRAGKVLALAAVGVVGVSHLYLAVDHPSDVAAAVVVGWALPILAFRMLVPEEAFPISYRGGLRAHLDVTGARQQAILQALDQQLGLDVATVEPFGLEGSAGSTPLRIRTRASVRTPETVLFAKLYAVTHLRADRWYKLARTIVYGRLEDEKPFSSVRRLVEYEDHMLRLMRDAGLPTPRPYGFVEITPEREYLIVMELFEGAHEIGAGGAGDGDVAIIDDALATVRRLWDAGVAHRDIKPSNLLVRDGRVLLIDVAFATVRPTPWRQAVDLANMMLTLALSSTPELVYERACWVFAADDVAEAFAASRSVTVPTQLRARVGADGRELPDVFRRLAPRRSPVAIQLWSVRRVGVTLLVLVLTGLGLLVLLNSVRAAGLAGGPAGAAAGPGVAVPGCTDATRLSVVAQSVPGAADVPCVASLGQGWMAFAFEVARGHTRFSLVSDRARSTPVRVTLTAGCDVAGAVPTTPRADGVRSYVRLTSISPRYAGTMLDVFGGGCVTTRFDFVRGPHIALIEGLQQGLGLVSRRQLRLDIHRELGVQLDP